MVLLRELDCPTVLGNADAFVLDADAGAEAPTERQLTVRDWTREQIGSEGLTFIETFQPTLTLSLGDGRELLAFHGSPSSYDDIILPPLEEDEFRRMLGPPSAAVMAGGHVHLQWLRRYGASTFVNPGSVGLSYDHVQPDDDLRVDAFAAYARIETGDGRLEIAFRRVGFDSDAVISAIRSSGVPHAESLVTQWQPRL
jgi:diadenosine tetraphosphatase ApaH/serine/threonine PP2A family protein phosphatase